MQVPKFGTTYLNLNFIFIDIRNVNCHLKIYTDKCKSQCSNVCYGVKPNNFDILSN